MNELFSNPFYMFATIVVAVTIGVFAGGVFLKKWMRRWMLSQSILVNNNIAKWSLKLKPLEGHVKNLKQTSDDFLTTQKRYEQLADDFRGHATGMKNHLSRADAILNTYQRELHKKYQDEKLDATDIKNQLQQLRQFTADVTNHHKYNSLVEKLPALKSKRFEEISDDFFEINAQLENFKKGLSPEEHNALMEQWNVFGELLAAMIECITKMFSAECTKAIDPSRTQQMDKKLEEVSQEFTEKTDNFVDQMATAQNELQNYRAERLRQQEQQQEYSQYRGQSRSR